MQIILVLQFEYWMEILELFIRIIIRFGLVLFSPLGKNYYIIEYKVQNGYQVEFRKLCI